jgi:hypothetical protein
MGQGQGRRELQKSRRHLEQAKMAFADPFAIERVDDRENYGACCL